MIGALVISNSYHPLPHMNDETPMRMLTPELEKVVNTTWAIMSNDAISTTKNLFVATVIALSLLT